ncbi:MAG: zinc-ribbon domain-containing protein [bacterium]|nr:zinc-ribbon domain-containing protein [bacterium]
MIIRCEACGTCYRLADERVRPEGTRVRCARCQAVFTVVPVTELSEEELDRSVLEQENVAENVQPHPEQGKIREDRKRDALDFSEEIPPHMDVDTEDGSSEEKWLGDAGETEKKNDDDDVFGSPPDWPTDMPGPEKKHGGSLLGKLFKFLVYVMVVLVAVVVGALAGYFYQSGEPVDGLHVMQALEKLAHVKDLWQKPKSQEAPAERIQLMNFQGAFVVNRDAGQLFVIRGQALNGFREPRTSISVRGILHDVTGKVVAQRTVLCGNSLDDEALRKLPFHKIEESMDNPFGDNLTSLVTPAGKTVPFTIVFRNVPANVAEFVVEVSGSKPAPVTESK